MNGVSGHDDGFFKEAATAEDGGRVVHFVLVPFLAQGHLIPTLDLGLLLAQRGMFVTIVTTPFNAARFQTLIDRAQNSGLRIRSVSLRLPCSEVGIPEGSESAETVDTSDFEKFFIAMAMLEEPLKLWLQQRPPLPTCLISDFCHPWTRHVTRELKIPRLVFYSVCCFTQLCHRLLPSHYERENVTVEDGKTVVVPEIPHRIEVTRAQASGFFPNSMERNKEAFDAEDTSDGIVVNSVLDMEPMYVERYAKVMGKKVWTVGPVSLFHKQAVDMAARGEKGSVKESEVMNWLDKMEPRSVIYVSHGSLMLMGQHQAEEIGMGLEASGHPFMWVIKSGKMMPEVEAWLGEGFEERTRGRSLIIRGWAPQVIILSHPSVGGFVTHCGWNSSMEGITAGVPMVTWPCFTDQFLNERFMVDVLGTAVPVGVEEPAWWWECDVKVKREEVREAVERVMGGGEEGEERRRRAEEFRVKARKAMEVGGSSYVNMTTLIDDVLELDKKGEEDDNCSRVSS